ncbi:molybdenum cofactor biosynthesis protein A, partial [Burkholderia pseudomallei]
MCVCRWRTGATSVACTAWRRTCDSRRARTC